MEAEEDKEGHVVGDHAAPGGGEAHAHQADGDKGTADADEPHGAEAVDKGNNGVADALHHALRDNGDAVEGLRDGHHAQHGRAEQDDGAFGREEAHHGGREEIEERAGDGHQADLDQHDDLGQLLHLFVVPGAVGIAGQGGRRCLHAVAGHIEGGLDGVGDGVGGGGDLAERVDHGGENDIPQGGAEALEHIGKGDLQAGAEDGRVRPERMAPGRNDRMSPYGQRDADSAAGIGDGAGNGRADDAPAEAGQGDRQTEKADLTRGIDHQKIEADIDDIDANGYAHWRSRVSGGP